MKLILNFLVLSMISFSAFAADLRLSKEEFLERVEKGRISLDRAPVLAIPDVVQGKVFDAQRKVNPSFKPEMWYVYYIRDNKFQYSIFFEWWNNYCTLRIEELDPKMGKPNEKTMDPVGQKIDKKYCELVYKIKII